MTKLLHNTPPERVRLPDARIAGLFPDRCVDYDEAADRIDVDRMHDKRAHRSSSGAIPVLCPSDYLHLTLLRTTAMMHNSDPPTPSDSALVIIQYALGFRHGEMVPSIAATLPMLFHAPGGRRPWLFCAAWSISSGVISTVAFT